MNAALIEEAINQFIFNQMLVLEEREVTEIRVEKLPTGD